MVTIPTTEQLAMRILREFYVDQGRSVYTKSHFLLNDLGWTREDLMVGLNFCLEKGWIREKMDHYLLTDKGSRVAQ